MTQEYGGNVMAIPAARDFAGRNPVHSTPTDEDRNASIPVSVLRSLTKMLEPLPIFARGNMCKVLELEATEYLRTKMLSQAYASAKYAVNIQREVFGRGPNNLELVKSQLLVISLGIAINDAESKQVAESQLYDAYLSSCFPPLGILSKEEFLKVCLDFGAADMYRQIVSLINDPISKKLAEKKKINWQKLEAFVADPSKIKLD